MHVKEIKSINQVQENWIYITLLNSFAFGGREVIPILTRYEGVFDCFTTVVREEGFRGLFKVNIR